MFGKKKRSWYWLAIGSVIFSGIFYSVARFFKHAVEKESGIAPPKKKSKIKKLAPEELFI